MRLSRSTGHISYSLTFCIVHENESHTTERAFSQGKPSSSMRILKSSTKARIGMLEDKCMLLKSLNRFQSNSLGGQTDLKLATRSAIVAAQKKYYCLRLNSYPSGVKSSGRKILVISSACYFSATEPKQSPSLKDYKSNSCAGMDLQSLRLLQLYVA